MGRGLLLLCSPLYHPSGEGEQPPLGLAWHMTFWEHTAQFIIVNELEKNA